MHVGCTSVANFTGWNDQTDIPLYVNEKNTDIYKVLNNPLVFPIYCSVAEVSILNQTVIKSGEVI